MKKIDAHEMKLRKYLQISEGTLHIPFSQRPYEWEKDQVKRLFNDLTGLYDLEEEIHMLNFFTISSEGEDKIFDGQQRTITILLLVLIFIKKIEKFNMSEAGLQFQEKYLVEKDHSTVPPSEERKIVFSDKEIDSLFYEIISNRNKSEYEFQDYDNPSQKSIVRNYNLLNNLLTEFIEERNMKYGDILKLFNTILDNTILIVIRTATDNLARAMFETLNNTGKKLESFYVLKNDLVISLTEEKVQDNWRQIESNLEGYDPSHFLLAFSTILSGRHTKQKALSKIYDSYDRDSNESMQKLLMSLVLASKNYLYIKNPSQLKNPKEKEQVIQYKRLSQQIEIFEVTQHVPLILAMFMKNRSLIEINKTLSHILNLIIRRFYFNEERANVIESDIAELARRTFNDNLKLTTIIENIKKMSIDDEDLELAIKRKEIDSWQSKKRFKFILKEIYNLFDLNNEVQIKDSLDEIEYEHILPQRPKSNSKWLEKFNDDNKRKRYTGKVGNGTLLVKRWNIKATNKDFDLKKDDYLKSHVPENKKIAEKKDWGMDEIDNRTKDLSAKIIEYLDFIISSN
ncbi:DUF262 domain-containing protein [Salinicoccus roseus]|uniref:DUF262 domain-containing HNH endonuclease family protein n=1 Tax=Salinicoccus roseus TaxID=45670 RepID=A0A0C2HA38_9STAP|nr:DUF262 domain-containing HNH endonuclease family protein [Salinicoccus roseus]KIH70675.1 hypothetical protein SN16_08210 [Salinicoccus roseus]MDB0580784.1 DUF262 domain-containing HNH endonuclease family protein [Salinicoccus roseus]